MTSQTACLQHSCTHLSCRGPTGPFVPSVYLQVVVNTPSTPILVTATPVPLDVGLTNVGAIFDASSHAFVAPQTGPYRFEYTVALRASGASQVQVLAQVGNLLSTTPVPQLSLTTTLSSESDTLTGSAIVDLLQGQTFRLEAFNIGGACAILGAQSAAYPTLFCVYSLF